MVKKSSFFAVLFLTISLNVFSQTTISGKIINKETNTQIEFVNVGIPGKEIGTVSNEQGYYQLQISNENLNDTLFVSCIGYNSVKIKLNDLIKSADKNIYLTEKIIDLQEVLVRPKVFKTEILGVTTKNKSIATGFSENKLGYECGILMKVKKTAFLKKVNVNINHCSYDTVFYRMNVYEGTIKNGFENIMRQPFYIKIPKSQIKDRISVDIEPLNIVVNGSFLVTLEHVKDLGKGGLWFPAALFTKTYARKTSQGNWYTGPIGIALSVEADVEK